MAKIGIITNPHSKLNKRNPQIPKLLGYILGEKGILETTNNLDDLTRVARMFKEKGIELLAINGGDGTISSTLSAFIQEYAESPLPTVVLLRGGTINVTASNLGIKGQPEAILYRLLTAISSQDELETTYVQSLKVGNVYGFLFGTGISATYLKEYYLRKSNALGAILFIVKLYLSYFFNREYFNKIIFPQTVRLNWHLGSRTFAVTQQTMSILCSTLIKMPLGIKMFRLLKGKSSVMQCAIFLSTQSQLLYQIPLSLLHQFEGTMFGKSNWLAEKLSMSCDETIHYTVDGELYESKDQDVVVELGPKIQFLVC